MEKIDDDKEISQEKERGRQRRGRATKSEVDRWNLRSRSMIKIDHKIDPQSTMISQGEVTGFKQLLMCVRFLSNALHSFGFHC